MSFKAKDLHYEKQEPAFLRRMKGAYDANDGRSNVQIARPKKSRLKTGDGEDDEPLILDENGEVVGKKEFDGMVKGIAEDQIEKGSTEGIESVVDKELERKREEKQQLTGIIGGGGRKRKQVKPIGRGEGSEGEGDDPKSDHPPTKSKTSSRIKDDKSTTIATTQPPSSTKPKKKAKKIKLSFDDPE